MLGRIPQHGRLSGLLNASVAIVGMTSLLLLVQIGGVASMAYEVQRLEDSRTYWQESNYRAETEIARLQSLSRIEEEAITRLKMAPAKETIPIVVAKPLQARTTPPAANREPTPKPTNSKSWWQGLIDMVSQARGIP
ncbi:MAG: hypothetical protein Q8P59_14035 [Dehalococcoidia bacterium]|nr:hypothetical protein [Dehalococcoidia bacterium]